MKRSALPVGPVVRPVPAAGQYFYTTSPTATQAFTLGVGNLRLAPWFLPAPLAIDRLAIEVSSAGEAGSLFRIVLAADNGNGRFGSLILDAGTVDTSATGVLEKVLGSTLALPAGLLWIGGATQNVTTTQPTIRTTGAAWTPPIDMIPLGTSLPAANSGLVALLQSGVTGAAPSSLTPSGLSGSAARVIARAA